MRGVALRQSLPASPPPLPGDAGLSPRPPSLAIVSDPEDWILTPKEVAEWLARAGTGARLLYGRGQQLVRGETARLMRDKATAGEVLLFQPRSVGRSGFDFIAVKRQAAVPAQPHRVVGEPSDAAMDAIYRRLSLAARRRERCPLDADLARLTGLSVAQVKWRVRKLVLARRIATRVVATSADPTFRIVTILSTGAETAPPAQRN